MSYHPEPDATTVTPFRRSIPDHAKIKVDALVILWRHSTPEQRQEFVETVGVANVWDVISSVIE